VPLVTCGSTSHAPAATTVQVYTRELGRLVLPVSEQVFGDAEMTARRAALRSFETQLLGRSQGAALGEQLNKAMSRERDIKATANVAQSNMVCQVRLGVRRWGTPAGCALRARCCWRWWRVSPGLLLTDANCASWQPVLQDAALPAQTCDQLPYLAIPSDAADAAACTYCLPPTHMVQSPTSEPASLPHAGAGDDLRGASGHHAAAEAALCT
jgi:hypothetical protein